MPQGNHQIEAIADAIASEYALETTRKRSLLTACGIEEEHLSKNGQMHLHVLAEAAEILQLKDTHTSSYLMAISDLVEAVDVAEDQERLLKSEAQAATTRSSELEIEAADLERVQQQLEEAADEREKHENTTAMEQRTAEHIERQGIYEAELRALETALKDLRFDEHRERVEHHHIAALEADCAAIEAENERLRQRLAEYHDLPLDKDLAAATLREAQEDLAQLEDEFNRRIRSMV